MANCRRPLEWIACGEAVPGENGWYPTLWDGEPDHPALLWWEGGWCWGNMDPITTKETYDRIVYWFPLPDDPRGPAF